MADVETPDPSVQASIEMPNGVTLTGMGGDLDAIREQLDERHEERQESTPEPVAPVATTPAAETPKPTRGQKRFSELTAAAKESERRAEAAEARLKELEARAVAPTPPPAPPVPAPMVPAAVDVAPTRLKPTEDQVGVKYQSYSDFVEDLADWKAEQREAKLLQTLDARSTQRIEADRASRTRADFVKETVFPNGRTAYPDFDTVLQSTTKLVPFAVQEAILKLPKPEHAIYALAKDDTRIDSLTGLMADPIALGIAVAQLMPRESVAPPASTAPVVRTTNVPAPIQPVGAGTRTTSPTLQELAEQGRWDEYKIARAGGQIH